MDIRRTVRRWVAGLLGLALGAAVALGAVTLAPRTYEAHTDVLLTPAADVRASDALHDRLLGSYAMMLDSHTVAEAVHDRAGVAASAASIDADLSGSVVDGTSMLRATVRDRDPDTAATLSDAAAASLVDLMADRGIASTTDGTADADIAPAASDTTPTRSVQASVVEDAAVPTRASSPAAPEWIAVGAVAGLLLALAAASLTRSTPSARRSAGRRSAATPSHVGRHRG